MTWVWETRRGLAGAQWLQELVRALVRVRVRVLAPVLAPVLSGQEHRSWASGSAQRD
jgi:hypothetical protein